MNKTHDGWQDTVKQYLGERIRHNLYTSADDARRVIFEKHGYCPTIQELNEAVESPITDYINEIWIAGEVPPSYFSSRNSCRSCPDIHLTLRSESDPRWNCSEMVPYFAFLTNRDWMNAKIAEFEKLYGEAPDDLKYSAEKDI